MNKKIILTGETGSGKTYRVINEFNKDKKFVYTAPCRQLVYESYIEYSKENDSISTGEVHKYNNGSMFCVYESLEHINIDSFDSLIIDEAHFVSDPDRGKTLYDIIKKFEDEKDIYLVTATDTISRIDFKNYEHIHLKSNFKIPVKKEVDWYRFIENMENGLKTIIFCNSIRETFQTMNKIYRLGYKVEALNSSIDPDERLRIQYEFKNGDVQIICTTNVLAQGLNFPAENIFISNDMWNTDELIIQKLGRLGRPLICKSEEVYYCIADFEIPKKLKKKRAVKKKLENDEEIYFPVNVLIKDDKNYLKVRDNKVEDSSFKKHEIVDISRLEYATYNSIKYGRRFIEFIDKNINSINLTDEDIFNNIKNAMNIFKEFEDKMYNLILSLKNKYNRSNV